MFWAHARSHVRRHRVVELTMQGAPYWPVFGIGILLPGPKGTAEPDDGLPVAQWPASHGAGGEALWRSLCTDAPEPAATASPLQPAPASPASAASTSTSYAAVEGTIEGGKKRRLPPRYVARAVFCTHPPLPLHPHSSQPQPACWLSALPPATYLPSPRGPYPPAVPP